MYSFQTLEELKNHHPKVKKIPSVGIVLENNTIWEYSRTNKTWSILTSANSQKRQTVLEIFGAKGDGRTDDSEAFRKAIQYCIQNSETLLLDNKTYNIQNLNMSVNETLKIEGPGNLKGTGTLFNLEDNGFIEIQNTTFYGFRYIINLIDEKELSEEIGFNLNNVKAFDVGGVIYSTNKSKSTQNHTIKNSAVTNCTFNNIRNGFALRFYIHSCNDLSITGNKISNVKGHNYGVAIYAGEGSAKGSQSFKNIIISNNHIQNIEGSKEAVGIQVTGANNVIITNNTIENVYTNSELNADVEGIYTKCLNATISGNTLLNAGGFEGSIMIKGRIREDNRVEDGNAKGYNVSVFNNVIKFDKSFINRYKYKVNITGIASTSEGLMVTNNIIDGAEKGIVISSVNGNNHLGSAYIISNNLITNSFATDTKSLGAGIELASAHFKNVNIYYNMILNTEGNFSEYYGIYVNNCKYLENLRITDNTISELGKAIPNKRGVFISSKEDINHIIISNNNLSGLDFGVSFSSVKNIKVKAKISDNNYNNIKRERILKGKNIELDSDSN